MPDRYKILFISVPYHAGVVEVAGHWLPLYLVTVAGACQAAGFQCKIFDAMTKGVSMVEVREVIKTFQPQAVAVSMITSTAVDGALVLQAAKEIDPGIVTIAGGIHATFMHDEVLANGGCDFVVVGEGEETLVELLGALHRGGEVSEVRGLAYRQPDGGVTTTPARPLLASLDGRPMAWDLLDWQDYTYFILPGSRLGAVATSRGCTYSCTFCSQHKFWRNQWRARSPEDVMAEILLQHREYGVNVILLTDDYPTPDRERWQALLDLLIAARLPLYLLMETRAADIVRDRDILDKYRRAGIIHIYIGTESTSQKRLEMINKEQSIAQSKEALALCRQHNIITETSMILGFPDDTAESVQETIRLAQEFNPDFAHFLAITPWPYADIYADLKPSITVTDYRRYNLIEPVIKPAAMTLAEVDLAIIDGYRQFYMGKFAEILATRDDFKRRYLLTAVKRMMQHSFIRKKLGDLGQEMPAEMRRLLALSPL